MKRLAAATVTFEIVEAPKVKIAEVDFVGSNAFKQKKLRKVIKTRKWWMFSWITGSGVLKDEMFAEDKDKLIAFYQNEGYIDFELTDVQFEQINPKKMIVRFVVTEGQPYKVGSVEIKGNTAYTTEEIMRGIVSEGKRVQPRMLPGATKSKQNRREKSSRRRDFRVTSKRFETFTAPKALSIPGCVRRKFRTQNGDDGYRLRNPG
jgi:outer membrane protein assembly factor BamA